MSGRVSRYAYALSRQVAITVTRRNERVETAKVPRQRCASILTWLWRFINHLFTYLLNNQYATCGLHVYYHYCCLSVCLSVCHSVCVNKPKNGSEVISCTLDHFSKVCLFVDPQSQQNLVGMIALQALEIQTWYLAGVMGPKCTVNSKMAVVWLL